MIKKKYYCHLLIEDEFLYNENPNPVDFFCYIWLWTLHL